MKVFIYGAGASYSAQTNVQNPSFKAPLTNELFDGRYSVFATQIGISEYDLNKYRSEVANSQTLEAWLTEWWTRTQSLDDGDIRKEGSKGKFGRLAIYIWWMLYNVSNYCNASNSINPVYRERENKYYVLARKLYERNEEFGSISFNYDTLLDKALIAECEYELRGSLENYINWRVIKPHGSINWFFNGRYNLNSNNNVLIDAASQGMFKVQAQLNDMTVYSPFHELTLDHFRSCTIPLMLIPLRTKLYSHFDEFYQRILRAARELLSKANEIYFIGYRAEDAIIIELLQGIQHGVKVHVVGNNSTEKIMKRILSFDERLNEGLTFSGGFEKFCDEY